MTSTRHNPLSPYFSIHYVKRDPIGGRGQRAIAHIKAAKDAARAARTERMKTIVTQRLAEIQAAEAARQNKRRRR